MATVELTDPASFAGAFAYEHTDIPPEATLAEWRRERAAQVRAAKVSRRAVRRERLQALLTWRVASDRGRTVTHRVQAGR